MAHYLSVIRTVPAIVAMKRHGVRSTSVHLPIDQRAKNVSPTNALERIARARYHVGRARQLRFKRSRDPQCVEQSRDVVGLYLDPPERAVVFSFDAQSQIPALDRTQPACR